MTPEVVVRTKSIDRTDFQQAGIFILRYNGPPPVGSMKTDATHAEHVIRHRSENCKPKSPERERQ